MFDWFILISLIGEVFILSKLDKKLFGTLFTPFNILAFPYTAIVILAFFFAPTLGFIPLYMESVLVWIVGLFLFWLGGLAFTFKTGKLVRYNLKLNKPFLYEEQSERYVVVMAWLAIFVMSYDFFVTVNAVGGLSNLTTVEFRMSYGRGLPGYIRDFSYLLFVFLVGTLNRNKKINIITVLVLYILYISNPVKTWIMLPLVGGLIYRTISGRGQISLKNSLKIFLISYIAFNLVYLIGYGFNNVDNLFNVEIYYNLAVHFTHYFFAGVLAFGEVVRLGISIPDNQGHLIFNQFVNLINFIYSEEIISVVTDFFLDIGNGKDSNVHTLFGKLLMFLGYFGSIVYSLILGFISYFLFGAAITTRNCWVFVVFLFIASGLAFSWFEFYFWHLVFIEVPVYGLILSRLIKFLGKRYVKRN